MPLLSFRLSMRPCQKNSMAQNGNMQAKNTEMEGKSNINVLVVKCLIFTQMIDTNHLLGVPNRTLHV